MKKGDENMEHKDLWLVIGLTVILAVAVTLSTVSITGNYVFGGKVTPSVTTTNYQVDLSKCTATNGKLEKAQITGDGSCGSSLKCSLMLVQDSTGQIRFIDCKTNVASFSPSGTPNTRFYTAICCPK